MIHLPEPVEFTEVIAPIPIACSAEGNGIDVIAIGNGATHVGDRRSPPILQYTELNTISRLSCLRTFPFLIFRSSIICVKGEEEKNICEGDSGGPLVTSGNSSYLIGLTSFGPTSGCIPGAPAVFTRISYYKDWIKEITGVECKN